MKKTNKTSYLSIEDFKKQHGKKEEDIQIAFCNYVKLTYPDVVFACDLASGLKLPIWIAAKHKKMRSSRAHCDFFMAEPTPIYKGFFLELKRSFDEVYRRDGSMKQQIVKVKKNKIVVETYDHIQEQYKMILKLRSKGYSADFGLGLNDCIDKITHYMKNLNQKPNI